jgi:hypothetical protein
MVRYTLEQFVFLYDTHVKYGSARKFRRQFRDGRVFSRKAIHNLVNKIRPTGFFIDKEKKAPSAY